MKIKKSEKLQKVQLDLHFPKETYLTHRIKHILIFSQNYL